MSDTKKEPEKKIVTINELIDMNLAFNTRGIRLIMDFNEKGLLLRTWTIPLDKAEDSYEEDEETKFPRGKVEGKLTRGIEPPSQYFG